MQSQKNSARPDVYQRITAAIIERLENGVVPWQSPYKSGTYEAPRNYASGRAYSGINFFMLSSTPHERPYYLTFNQIQEAGGRIRKGAHGEQVIFWKLIEATRRAEELGKDKADQIPLVRLYHVFNVADVENVDFNLPTRPDVTDHERKQRAEELITFMPNPPRIVQDSHTQGYYHPGTDTVHTARSGYFNSPEDYYRTLFHELTHATGHASRLNRPGITEPTEKGSPAYSREELAAEMGAAMLCGIAGISGEHLLNQHAAYLDYWLRHLRADASLVVQAATIAQRAVNYITRNHDGEKGGPEA
jgi:antirestriction protein ArdC